MRRVWSTDDDPEIVLTLDDDGDFDVWYGGGPKDANSHIIGCGGTEEEALTDAIGALESSVTKLLKRRDAIKRVA